MTKTQRATAADRERQDLAWDRQIWDTIHAGRPTAGLGFSVFMAAERDLLDKIHGQALGENWARDRVAETGGDWPAYLKEF